MTSCKVCKTTLAGTTGGGLWCPTCGAEGVTVIAPGGIDLLETIKLNLVEGFEEKAEELLTKVSDGKKVCGLTLTPLRDGASVVVQFMDGTTATIDGTVSVRKQTKPRAHHWHRDSRAPSAKHKAGFVQVHCCYCSAKAWAEDNMCGGFFFGYSQTNVEIMWPAEATHTNTNPHEECK